MKVGDVLMALLVTAGAAFGARFVILLWRGHTPYYSRDVRPPGMPIPATVWPHYLRTTPTLVASSVPFAVAVVFATFDNGIFTILFAAIWAVGVLILAPSVFLFAKPKSLIAPACRADRGWITERRSNH
jgi:hypothetical protein